MAVTPSPMNTGKSQKRKLGLASRMASSAEAYSPVSNIAWLDGAVERGDVTVALREAMVAIEEALYELAKAMMVCQPRGASGSLSVRWWKVDGRDAFLRRPVLVRLERVGHALVPKRLSLRGRRRKHRTDGAFAVNASLIPLLVSCYMDLYAEWRGLRDLVVRTKAYRRVERRVCGRGARAVKASTGLLEACTRIGRGRAEAAGYDMDWFDRF